jgi:predicted RNA-binding protein with PUA-like domain
VNQKVITKNTKISVTLDRNRFRQLSQRSPTFVGIMQNIMQYWLIKSEPDAYSWETFVKEGKTAWTGVRNYQARNNLREMARGDLALYYHSNVGKEVIGIAEVIKIAYQDPTTDDPNWVCVDVRPKQAFTTSVSLEAMKAEPTLENMGLLRQSRLSVVKLTVDEFNRICAMGIATKEPTKKASTKKTSKKKS